MDIVVDTNWRIITRKVLKCKIQAHKQIIQVLSYRRINAGSEESEVHVKKKRSFTKDQQKFKFDNM